MVMTISLIRQDLVYWALYKVPDYDQIETGASCCSYIIRNGGGVFKLEEEQRMARFRAFVPFLCVFGRGDVRITKGKGVG